MTRTAPLLLAATVAALASGCWAHGSGGGSPVTESKPATKALHLKPGHYRFHLGGRVNVGDKILCVTRDGGPAGGGGVPEAGEGVSSSTGFSVFVFPSGRVKITCPANPGNA